MKAELIDHMGTDLTVVNAARVSLYKESSWEFGKLKDNDAGLIRYLAEHEHFTPFTHPQITMREKVPIFIARQRFKHTVGFTYNEVSRRYVDNKPEFYSPDGWRCRPDKSIKQGSSKELVEHSDLLSEEYNSFLLDVLHIYNGMIISGVAPEQARMVLPQSMYTEYYVTGSLAAWARAYSLRSSPESQKEIRDLAGQWGDVLSKLYPVSWEALT